MSRLFLEDGESVPVTAVSVCGNFVAGKKTTDKNGYNALLVSKATKSNNLPKSNTLLPAGSFKVLPGNCSLGDITDIFLINKGSAYAEVPTVSITSSGSNAKVLAYGTEIGRVIGLKSDELGEGYEKSPTPPTIKF